MKGSCQQPSQPAVDHTDLLTAHFINTKFREQQQKKRLSGKDEYRDNLNIFFIIMTELKSFKTHSSSYEGSILPPIKPTPILSTLERL